MREPCRRIGFVSTRLAGTDGVSLEVGKWEICLSRQGHKCFFFCGKSGWPADRTRLVAEAYFKHPDVYGINQALFENKQRPKEMAQRLFDLKQHLKEELYAFVRQFDIDLLIVENALSLPMNLPLGLAIAEYIGETSMPSIAHHHDFWWERPRYLGSPAEDLLRGSFPLPLPSVQHVVINSVAARELSFRTGVNANVIPNVMDFGSSPEASDDYAEDLRAEIGVSESNRLILQPTRMVPRKQIQRAIELVKWVEEDCSLVITHESGDEGKDYETYLLDFAELLGVDLILAPDRFDYTRGSTDDGRKVYSIADAYREADLVTYPSKVEGFGNAFLETVYYRKPIVMEAYEIFQLDIAPKGFRIISLCDFISRDVIEQTSRILQNESLAREWVEANFDIGRRFYSFETLDRSLEQLIGKCPDGTKKGS